MEPTRHTTATQLERVGFGTMLAQRAADDPDFTVFTFLSDDGEQAEEVTFGQLNRRAQTIAAGLAERQRPGRRTLLLFPPGLDYVSSVYACFQAGIVGVSAPPPQPKRLHRTLPRLTAIAADAEIESVLTTAFIRDAAKPLLQDTSLEDCEWIAVDTLPEPSEDVLVERPLDQLAFLQYTSGSTRNPRGVMLSLNNLLNNSDLITKAFGHRPNGESKGMIWLPPYHDMGLIGGILQPIYGHGPCILMSPLAVIKRPARWLEAISRYKATTSGGPNFAYDLCVRRVDEEVCEHLDLSSWEVAFNGAEPIRAETLDAFSRKFAAAGFRRSSFFPCYGLAEATLIVTGPDKEDEPSLLEVDRDAVEQGRIQPADGEDARILVGCGTPFEGHALAIVDPASGRPLPEGEVGEIWTRGPSVALGYWNQPEGTGETFAGKLAEAGAEGYLRTGDLGALVDGELYVVGRIKELIIVNGRNIHPHDIEFCAEEAHPLVRAHCGAAFDRGGDPVEISLLLEVDAAEELDAEEILRVVRERVAEELDLPLAWIGLCGRGEVPKTTSGKIQRNLCRKLIDAGEIPLLAEDRRA
ncbi:MAG TPA: fatty acyl-AMP ligase [Solirubrobacterales bacterium]|nr:fatty acyl-AMP ligase [Solirubrobacterales bacterium]